MPNSARSSGVLPARNFEKRPSLPEPRERVVAEPLLTAELETDHHHEARRVGRGRNRCRGATRRIGTRGTSRACPSPTTSCSYRSLYGVVVGHLRARHEAGRRAVLVDVGEEEESLEVPEARLHARRHQRVVAVLVQRLLVVDGAGPLAPHRGLVDAEVVALHRRAARTRACAGARTGRSAHPSRRTGTPRMPSNCVLAELLAVGRPVAEEPSAWL